MKVVNDREALRFALEVQERIGFVPTMGALHPGHLSLVKESKQRGLFTVASIFVNPTQFNNKADFEAYPVDTDADVAMLETAGCDVVFIPSKETVYPDGEVDHGTKHDFGHLEDRYEGAFRPGHFKGVGQVVHILFDLVQPDVAFFGEKDFQQVQVIRSLVKQLKLPIEIVGMPTIREEDGLAMSSRNRRLNERERNEALLLIRALQYAKDNFGRKPLDELRSHVAELFDQSNVMRLEYFDIIDPVRFSPLQEGEECLHPHAIIAAYAGEVRLIDNMALA